MDLIQKETIDASHLPDSEKSRLKNLLDELGERAKRGEYANNKEINANFGMFGTGLYTFGQKQMSTHQKTLFKCVLILRTFLMMRKYLIDVNGH